MKSHCIPYKYIRKGPQHFFDVSYEQSLCAFILDIKIAFQEFLFLNFSHRRGRLYWPSRGCRQPSPSPSLEVDFTIQASAYLDVSFIFPDQSVNRDFRFQPSTAYIYQMLTVDQVSVFTRLHCALIHGNAVVEVFLGMIFFTSKHKKSALGVCKK